MMYSCKNNRSYANIHRVETGLLHCVDASHSRYNIFQREGFIWIFCLVRPGSVILVPRYQVNLALVDCLLTRFEQRTINYNYTGVSVFLRS